MMPAAKDPEIINVEAVQVAGARRPPALPRPLKRKRHVGLWMIFVLLIGVFLWLATSGNPFAEGIQEFAGNKHDQAVVDTPFPVSPHNFRYYKFSLPEASTNVAIVGDFTVLPDADRFKNRSKRPAAPADDAIEVYVLSDSAFAVWQTGYTTSSVFESGRVAQGKIAADLPAGAGVYYLVFSNKFASTTPKKVDASIVLHYKNWVPEWIRRAKSELWSWMF